MPVRTVVVDTNFLGRGTFSAKAGRVIGSLVEAGNHVVVPMPVIWEWAERSHTLLAAAKSALEDASRAAAPSIVEVPNIEVPSSVELSKRIAVAVRDIGPNIRIAQIEMGEASRAIEAQTLLSDELFERRSGVKTGAVDAMILSCVRVAVRSGGQGAVALCTQDAGLGRAAFAIEGLVVHRDQKALFQWALTRADVDVADDAIEQLLQSALISGELAAALALHREAVNLELDDVLLDDANGLRVRCSLASPVSLEWCGFAPLSAEDSNLGLVQIEMVGTAVIVESSPYDIENVVKVAAAEATAVALITFDADWNAESFELIDAMEVTAESANAVSPFHLSSLDPWVPRPDYGF